ncbi:hypothetical protein [Sediminicurvatus halobius]|uniref:Uncharacterized protein n=1 Tax=Sediminicurvatus halobius TaxID=2182432 RepID=A0A2U2N9I8_9GAMM|nr:hypothetical protein [Spiribacter halobius]PWG65851.1 hypothetical protein DEM34_00890 [Spiribacter halobius]UEX77898.1 hypothetical protein LMH63_18530 [Spiribacter halobius]
MTEAERSEDAAADGDGLRDIAGAVKALSADMARLVLVEAQLFGHTALAMIGLAVAIALLLVGAWLFSGAALVVALTGLQAFSATGALLTVALAHLALAGLALWRLRHITRDLTFRESRASVNGLLARARSPGDASGQSPGEG